MLKNLFRMVGYRGEKKKGDDCLVIEARQDGASLTPCHSSKRVKAMEYIFFHS